MPAAKSGGNTAVLNLLQMFSGKDGKPDLSKLNDLENALKGKIEIIREGEQIVLPPGMSYDEAITWLLREKTADEAEVAVNEQIQTVPVDGAVAFYRVLQKRFGFVNLVKTPGFFGDRPPFMLGVVTGPNPEDVVQVPWGRMELPGVDGYLQTSANITDGRPVFVLAGVVKRANEQLVHDIATDVRKYLETDSIYRGKAIKVEFNEADADRDNPFDDKFMPKFLPLQKNMVVILNDDARARLDVELYNVVRYSADCRQLKIPLKRGVLLEGPYGTGKTLTAYDLAATCSQNGWTFIYVENSQFLDKAIGFAKLYQPCVIFAEDIDKVIESQEDPELTTIRNALDSIEGKATEIMVVLTTNHIEKLHEGFLRCGRIDSIVTIGRPDTAATVALARLYGGQTIHATDAELATALQPVVGQSAAVIREAVERAKLAAVSHYDRETGVVINAADLATTATTLASHAALLNRGACTLQPHPAVASHDALVKEIVDRLQTGTLGDVAKEIAQAVGA
jgi:transitional endoplasmic reticulum ATPase